MATKKEATKTETKPTSAKVKEDDGLVEVFIPIDYSNPDEMTLYVGVNGVSMLVPKGRKVKVKPKFAAEIERMLAEKDRQYQAAEEQRLRDLAKSEYINSTY